MLKNRAKLAGFTGCLLVQASLAAAFTLTSKDFLDSQPIPASFTCNGENIIPSLTIANPPTGTKSMALTLDDPDAPGGNWVHWIVFNIPGSTTELSESILTKSIQGTNSWDSRGYSGPCPPSGTHHYNFTLYALDNYLVMDASADERQLLKAIQTHILGKTSLTGIYSKE